VGAGEGTPVSKSQGFEPEIVTAFLRRNADLLEKASVGSGARPVVLETASSLLRVADEVRAKPSSRLEDLERRLTVMEEKLFAALLTSTSDEELVNIRAEADRDLAPYRRKMSGPQIEQLQKQYVNKRLLEKYRLPRLSLFYM
jgi:hypothetical protein